MLENGAYEITCFFCWKSNKIIIDKVFVSLHSPMNTDFVQTNVIFLCFLWFVNSTLAHKLWRNWYLWYLVWSLYMPKYYVLHFGEIILFCAQSKWWINLIKRNARSTHSFIGWNLLKMTKLCGSHTIFNDFLSSFCSFQ